MYIVEIMHITQKGLSVYFYIDILTLLCYNDN
uniref:Uncharacterized protein n=1 Tax=Myoviridae sp. ctQYc56 TaxID=2825100 RepID=A0A8S5Q1D0_9CAUD|nr:MAG TPA: hypothetical protein [Myoviridae sp. ctQYc56]